MEEIQEEPTRREFDVGTQSKFKNSESRKSMASYQRSKFEIKSTKWKHRNILNILEKVHALDIAFRKGRHVMAYVGLPITIGR